MNIKEHFMNPKNVGKIKKTEYTGKNKSGFCGDTIEVYLSVKNNTITDAKYQACGCWALIGSASILSEYVKGKNLDDVLKISDEDYFSLLGEIPEEKINCVLVTKNAFILAAQKQGGV